MIINTANISYSAITNRTERRREVSLCSFRGRSNSRVRPRWPPSSVQHAHQQRLGLGGLKREVVAPSSPRGLRGGLWGPSSSVALVRMVRARIASEGPGEGYSRSVDNVGVINALLLVELDSAVTAIVTSWKVEVDAAAFACIHQGGA